jgi:hypothetical protein
VTFALAVAAGTGVAVPARWWSPGDRADWSLTPTAPVNIARMTFAFLIAFMFLNGVKQFGDPRSLRRVGNVWDVITFWPRTFHPFAVRPYAERAVPEVQEFLFGEATRVHRRREVVVVAHSQGSVIAYAALRPAVRAGLAGLEDIRLVTAGSPLRSLYLAAFPWYVRPEHLAETIGAKSDGLPRLDWVNVFRFTDHVGRAVFAPDEDVAAQGGRAGADRPISDPLPGHAVSGHNDYWTDPRVVALVAQSPAVRQEEVAGARA